MRGAAMMLLPAIALCSAAPSPAATQPQNDRAYTLTLMCAVVASHYGGDADIHRTMDAARKMGKAKGYAGKRVSDDLVTMSGALGAELRNNPTSMDENREVCRKLKLVS